MDKGLRNTILTVAVAMIPAIGTVTMLISDLQLDINVQREQIRSLSERVNKMDDLMAKVEDIRLKVNTLAVKFEVKDNEGNKDTKE